MVKAFTSAEILITLVIIGIIATMTIPALAQTIIDRQMVSKLLKMQNILSTAYKNNFSTYGSSITDYSSKEQVVKAFEDAFIGVSHDCLNDTCLHDGTEISYSDFDSGCSISAPGSASTLRNSCMSIVTDLNGVKKKPNKAGKDRFRFWVTKDGVYPEGDLNSCSNGYDCTAYVVLNQKLFDYEKKNAMEDKPEGCIDAECTGCDDGYTLNEGICTPINLQGCTNYSGVECSKCSSGYVLYQGVCQTLESFHCLAVSDGNQCTQCSNGYTLKNDICVALPENTKNINGINTNLSNSFGNYNSASNYCNSIDMRLPTVSELQTIYADCETLDSSSCGEDYWASNQTVVRYSKGGQVLALDPSYDYVRFLCVSK